MLRSAGAITHRLGPCYRNAHLSKLPWLLKIYPTAKYKKNA